MKLVGITGLLVEQEDAEAMSMVRMGLHSEEDLKFELEVALDSLNQSVRQMVTYLF